VDALRFWVASSDFSRDVTIGPTVLARTGEALRKVRNTARFLVGATGGLDYAPGALFEGRPPPPPAAGPAEWWCAPPDALAAAWALPFPAHALLPPPGGGAWPLRALDAALLARAAAVEAGVRAAFEALAFERAVYLINGFASRDLSATYCDAVKDRLYQDGGAGAGAARRPPPRAAAQAVLWECLRVLTRCLAPVAPFTAEEIYLASQEGVLGVGAGASTVFHTPWRPLPPALSAPGAAFSPGAPPLHALWGALMGLRAAAQGPLEAARAAGLIGSPAEGAVVIFAAPGGAAAAALVALGAPPAPPAPSGAPPPPSAPQLEELLTVSHAASVALPAAGAAFPPAGLLPPAPPPLGAPPPPAAPEPGGAVWWAWALAGAGAEEGSGGGAAAQPGEWLLVRVARADGAPGGAGKCARCWKYRQEVARSADALCRRCEEVLREE
jgi:isoleucyl-tRNA synthetase